MIEAGRSLHCLSLRSEEVWETGSIPVYNLNVRVVIHVFALVLLSCSACAYLNTTTPVQQRRMLERASVIEHLSPTGWRIAEHNGPMACNRRWAAHDEARFELCVNGWRQAQTKASGIAGPTDQEIHAAIRERDPAYVRARRLSPAMLAPRCKRTPVEVGDGQGSLLAYHIDCPAAHSDSRTDVEPAALRAAAILALFLEDDLFAATRVNEGESGWYRTYILFGTSELFAQIRDTEVARSFAFFSPESLLSGDEVHEIRSTIEIKKEDAAYAQCKRHALNVEASLAWDSRSKRVLASAKSRVWIELKIRGTWWGAAAKAFGSSNDGLHADLAKWDGLPSEDEAVLICQVTHHDGTEHQQLSPDWKAELDKIGSAHPSVATRIVGFEIPGQAEAIRWARSKLPGGDNRETPRVGPLHRDRCRLGLSRPSNSLGRFRPFDRNLILSDLRPKAGTHTTSDLVTWEQAIRNLVLGAGLLG